MKYGRYMSDVALLSHKIAKYCLVVTFIIVWFCVVLQGGSKKKHEFQWKSLFIRRLQSIVVYILSW